MGVMRMLNSTTQNAELVRRWLLDLRRRNRRPNTIAAYAERVDLLVRWAGDRQLLHLATEDLEQWLDSRKLTAASRAAYITALHSLYRWAHDHDLIAADPSASLERPTVRPGRPRPVADDELARALASATPMLRAVLLLGALAGLRVGEIATLRAEDIDLDAGVLEVVHGKGDKSRFVPVHPVLAEALRCLPMPREGWLFRAPSGLPLTPQAIRMRLRKVLVGTPHQLRHAAATQWFKISRDLLTVANLLGHENPATTKIYAKWDLRYGVDVVSQMKVPGAWN